VTVTSSVDSEAVRPADAVELAAQRSDTLSPRRTTDDRGSSVKYGADDDAAAAPVHTPHHNHLHHYTCKTKNTAVQCSFKASSQDDQTRLYKLQL